MASCGLCSSFGRTKIQYSHDLARQHAETHFLQLKIIDDGITTDQIFKKCFPDFVGRKNSGRKDLIALCNSLFPKPSLTSSSRHVICEKCDDEINIIDRQKRLKTNVLVEHACYHLKLNVYECRHCDGEFRNQKAITKHLNTSHQLHTTIGHVRSKGDDFGDDISAMIKQCFGGRTKTPHRNGAATRSANAFDVRSHPRGSHMAVERQLLCFRIFWKMADQNGTVQCRLCSKGIKAAARSTRWENIKLHAYRHLPTPLYRCRLCSKAFFGPSEIQRHLRVVHALPCLKQNYECLADQYHSDLLASINKCYGDDTVPSSEEITFRNLGDSTAALRRSTQSKLTVSRLLLCHQLIRKRANAKRAVQCRICSKDITAMSPDGNSLKTSCIMQHAFLHLGKPLYKCRECPKNFVNRDGAKYHSKREHNRPRDCPTEYQCSADQYHGDIVAILQQCYGDVERTDEKEEGRSEDALTRIKHEPGESTYIAATKLTIERRTLCNQLTRELSNQKDKRLQCRLCPRRISIKSTKGGCNTKADSALMHALSHLEKPIYRCKICSETCFTSINMRHHMRTRHALPMTNNYDNLGDQFHAEIVEMLRKCYNKEETTTNEAKPSRSQARDEAHVRARAAMNGSKETAERQLFCYRLVRKFAKSDGNMECRPCKKRICVMKGEHYASDRAMKHAMVHLKEPVYRCTVCSEKRSNFASLSLHLKQVHALPLAKNYESLGDEYHTEILAQLRKCYGDL